jgi:hypothetical protein
LGPPLTIDSRPWEKKGRNSTSFGHGWCCEHGQMCRGLVYAADARDTTVHAGSCSWHACVHHLSKSKGVRGEPTAPAVQAPTFLSCLSLSPPGSSLNAPPYTLSVMMPAWLMNLSMMPAVGREQAVIAAGSAKQPCKKCRLVGRCAVLGSSLVSTQSHTHDRTSCPPDGTCCPRLGGPRAPCPSPPCTAA